MEQIGSTRCSVCGKNTRFHKAGQYAVCVKREGRWTPVTEPYLGSRCGAVRHFQGVLLAGVGEAQELRKIKG